MNDNDERLAIVESKVSTHADEIRRMRESAHEHDNLLTAMQATLRRSTAVCKEEKEIMVGKEQL